MLREPEIAFGARRDSVRKLFGVIPVVNSETSPTRAADALAEATSVADKQRPATNNSRSGLRTPSRLPRYAWLDDDGQQDIFRWCRSLHGARQRLEVPPLPADKPMPRPKTHSVGRLSSVGATGFEPATARPPAGLQGVTMRPGASLASPTPRSTDLLDLSSGTKVVPMEQKPTCGVSRYSASTSRCARCVLLLPVILEALHDRGFPSTFCWGERKRASAKPDSLEYRGRECPKLLGEGR